MDKDYPIPSSSRTPSPSQPNKLSKAHEDIMELLWHNGQLGMQSQSQRLPMRASPLEQSSSQQQQQQQQQIFMHEDEMCSWLHYPLVAEDPSSFDHNFCADLLYPPPPPPSSSLSLQTTTVTTTVATANVPVRTVHVSMSEPEHAPNSGETSVGGLIGKQSLMPPPLFSRGGPKSEPSVRNLGLFSGYKYMAGGSGPSAALPDTVVDSSDTPSIELEAAKQIRVEGGKNLARGFVAGGSSAGGERAGGEIFRASSSPGGSSASDGQGVKQPVEDRKRKGIEAEEAEGQAEDLESESAETKRQARGSMSSKRSRAAEVHNLSERRRRDRINEKMRALQELIPRCNKSDKASMLDEAIEYLKSLQLQVQMMSMGYGMVPVMYPGMQQYMPPMGMGLGTGMNLEMGMNRPMMPYPFPYSAFSTTGASAHIGPGYPIMPPSPFHMPPTPVQDPSRLFQTSQPDPALNSGGALNPIPPHFPLYRDPYQQYHVLPQMQLTLPQNQVTAFPNTSKPGPSRGQDNADNPNSG